MSNATEASAVTGKTLDTSDSGALLAPAWHTALLVVFVGASSIAGAIGSRHFIAGRRGNMPTYLASIALEWVLAGLVLWGLRLRRTPLRAVLGEIRPGGREWLRDAAVAAVFWVVAMMLLGVVGGVLKLAHLQTDNIRAIVSKLAPSTGAEIAAWIVLCLSAGICEEFVFRGYLQLQFARMSRRVWLGVIASATVFGFSHGYEGWSGMLLIVAYGALFGVLRLIRGNLRAGMIAHAWHDFLSGMVLYAIVHSRWLK